MAFQELRAGRAHARGGVEGAARRLVGHEFDAAEQAAGANVPDERVVGQAFHALAHDGSERAHALHDALATVDLDRLDAQRAAERMTAIGVAVAEHADLGRLVLHRLHDLVGQEHAAQRHVGGGELLGDGDRVGPHAERFGAEPRAGAPEAADHLVVDQHDVVVGEQLGYARPVAFRRHDHAARAHDGLADHGGDGVGAFPLDRVGERCHETVAELGLAFSFVAEAVVMRAVGVDDALEGQVELAVVVGQAGERGGHHGHPVVGLHARDDLLLARAPPRVVDVPGQLDLRIVGFRPGRGEQNLGDVLEARFVGELLQLLRQLDRGLGALAGELVVVGQSAHLLGGGLDHLLVAEAEPRAPQAAHALDVFAALRIGDPHAAPVTHDERTHLAHAVQGRIGVDDRVEIARLQVGKRRLAVDVHGDRLRKGTTGRTLSRRRDRPQPVSYPTVSRFEGLRCAR